MKNTKEKESNAQNNAQISDVEFTKDKLEKGYQQF